MAALCAFALCRIAVANPIALPSEVECYAPMTLPVRVDDKVITPYDPAVISVEAEFKAPSGAILRIPAYYYEEYDPVLNSVGKGRGWRLRFTPAESGVYSVRLSVRKNSGKVRTSSRQTFRVKGSARPGFVVAKGAGFRRTTGQKFLMVGANRSWGDPHATDEYLADLVRLKKSGARIVRVWLAPWWLPVEAHRGRYDQLACARLDAIFAKAEELGLGIILCIEQHGNFQPAGGEIGLWPKHPYNRANGGPCRSTRDFFTNGDAARLFRNRLRYLIARYSYSTTLVAWELFNEVEFADFGREGFEGNRTRVLRWHLAMAKWLRANDPFKHMVATSGDATLQLDLARRGGLDFVQLHIYTDNDIAGAIRLSMEKLKDRPALPVVISEFGLRKDAQGTAYVTQGLYAAMMLTCGGGGLPWLQDEKNLADAYPRLGGVANFFEHMDWAGQDFKTLAIAPKPVGHVPVGPWPKLLAIRGKSEAILFLHDIPPKPKGVAMKPRWSATLKDLPPGAYHLKYWDSRAGVVIASQTASTRNGILTLRFPAAGKSVSVRLRHVRKP
jgi:Cellulase (glycosyl hydrolase family 5)